jgi:glycosyltransferase involved in cell wall biosynthesis
LVPIWDERRILWQLGRAPERRIAHFLWGEFGSLKRVAPYHRRGIKVVVSVHCSARRWDSVWLRPDGYANADQVVLTSDSQRPHVARHVPPERIRTILHGVVADYFTPPATREPRTGRFRMFMLGDTERDHAFAAQVAAKLPADKFEWRIRTLSHEKAAYAGISCVNLLPRLADEEMREEYRQADVLVMPMLDSAANNVILESMACGTPVMVNRVGGVPEYVNPECNFYGERSGRMPHVVFHQRVEHIVFFGPIGLRALGIAVGLQDRGFPLHGDRPDFRDRPAQQVGIVVGKNGSPEKFHPQIG